MSTDAQPLLAQSTLVVAQRAKLFELRNEYSIRDRDGNRIGTVTQINQSLLTLVTRVLSSLDVALPITLEIRDQAGAPVLVLDKAWLRWTIEVRRPDGTPVGTLAKQARFGKARFGLRDAAGNDLGQVRARNWRAKDFSVLDARGDEVARVAKRWEGFAKAIFTDADNYVVELSPDLVDPLRSLAAASCLVIDVIMKQKDTD